MHPIIFQFSPLNHFSTFSHVIFHYFESSYILSQNIFFYRSLDRDRSKRLINLGTTWPVWPRILTVKLKIPGKLFFKVESRTKKCEKRLFYFSHFFMVAELLSPNRYHWQIAKVKNYNLNVTEVLDPTLKKSFPGIFNFTIGILFPQHFMVRQNKLVLHYPK